MKLIQLSIKNFKSIKNLKIDINSNKTLIIGKNNCGKSNLLELLSIILKLGSSSYDIPSFNTEINKDEYYNDPEEPMEAELLFELDGDIRKYPKEISDYAVEDEGKKLLKISFDKDIGKDGEFYIGSTTVTYPEYVKTARFIYFNCVMLGAVRGYKTSKNDENSIYSIILLNILRYVCKRNQTEIEKRYDLTEKDFSDYICKILADFFNDELFVSRAIPDFKEISFYISENTKEDIKKLLQSEFNTHDDEKIISNLYIMVDDGKVQELRLKGMGVQSIFLTNLILQANKFFPVKPIICIDEAELHLHPQALRRFNDMLTEISKDNQLIITTHSPIFIKEMDIFDVVLLKKELSTNAYQLPKECELNREMLKRELNEFNSEMLFANAVILVEGLSEKIFIRHIANSCMDSKYNLDLNNISIIPVYGKENIKFYSKILLYFKIPHTILLDLDGLSVSNDILKVRKVKPEISIDKKKHIAYLKTKDIIILENGEIEDYYPKDLIKTKFLGEKDVEALYSNCRKTINEGSMLDIAILMLSKYTPNLDKIHPSDKEGNTIRKEIKKSYDKSIDELRRSGCLTTDDKKAYEILESIFGPIGKPRLAIEMTYLLKNKADINEELIFLITRTVEISQQKDLFVF